MSLVNCNFCHAQGGCSLSLTHPYWGELVQTAPVHNFPRGATIYRQGFPAEGVFLLCRGSIKLTTISEAGIERICEIVTCGELFGLDCLIEGSLRTFSAVARENSQAVFVRTALFHQALHTRADLLWNVTLMLNQMLQRANQQKLVISGARVRDRIESVLADLSRRLKISDDARKPAFAKLKQCELSELLGVPEETISRELRPFRENGGSGLIRMKAPVRKRAG